jgi:hypothetical protein
MPIPNPDLMLGVGPLDDPAAREFDADRTLAVEQAAADQRVGDEAEVRPLQRRPA